MVVFLYIILSLYFREGIDHLRFSTICEVTPPPQKKKKKNASWVLIIPVNILIYQ